MNKLSVCALTRPPRDIRRGSLRVLRHPARSGCQFNEEGRARSRLTGIRTRGSPKP
jgi:hypothetical protein